jgi:hypothetical protein
LLSKVVNDTGRLVAVVDDVVVSARPRGSCSAMWRCSCAGGTIEKEMPIYVDENYFKQNKIL